MKRLTTALLFGSTFALLFAFACTQSTGGSQFVYSYPGCVSGGAVCPNDETLTCGLLDILAKDNTCTKDTDCVASEVSDKCIAVISCDGPPAVNRDKKAEFEAAFNAQLDKYCAEPSCTSVPGCTPGPRRNVLVCFEGHCARAFRPLDAGFPQDDGGQPYVDGGTTDAGTDAGTTTDSGVIDSGVIDSGVVDSGVIDSGVVDAGSNDGGVVDAG